MERIGELLVARGVLDWNEVSRILSHSLLTGKKFCDAGLELKILTAPKLIQAFAPGFRGDFLELCPASLSRVASTLISPEDMILHGVLPIGSKSEGALFGPRRRRILSLGMLDPAEFPRAARLLNRGRSQDRRIKPFEDVKGYLVLINQFLDALSQVYGITDQEIRSLPPEKVSRVLREFLQFS